MNITNDLDLHLPPTTQLPSLYQVVGNCEQRTLYFNECSGNTRILYHNKDLELNYFVKQTYLHTQSFFNENGDNMKICLLIILSKKASLNPRDIQWKDGIAVFLKLMKI